MPVLHERLESRPIPSGRRRLALLLGAAAVLVVAAALYAHAQAQGRWPASHPWGGLAFVAASVNLALHALRGPDTPADAPRYLVAAAVLGASVLVLLGANS